MYSQITTVQTSKYMKKNTRFGITLGTILALLTGNFMYAYADTLNRQLQLGMSGADVTVLQTFLASDATIYPQGRITGYFGFLTKAAVSNFQARNGISRVGRVGPLTMAAINAQMGNSNTIPSSVRNISPVTVTSSNGTMNVTWTTPMMTRAVVYYSTIPLTMYENENSVTISGSTMQQNNFNTTHSVQIPNVVSGTTYYYSVYTTDQNGMVNMTWPATFRVN